MWKDFEEKVSKKNWNEILYTLSKMGIYHFYNVVIRTFGKRKILIALWIGNNEVKLYGDKNLLVKSTYLSYIIKNIKSDSESSDLEELFKKAKKKKWGVLGGRIEVFNCEYKSTNIQTLFFVESDDIFFSRDIEEAPVVHRDKSRIPKRDLLYYLEAQVRDILYLSVASIEDSKQLNATRQNVNSTITSIINAFHGIERMAILEYTYYILNDAESSKSNFSINELKHILELLENLSEMKVEHSEAEGGIIFSKKYKLKECVLPKKKLIFEKNVDWFDQKKVRKYLDISNGKGIFLLFLNDILYGIASISERKHDYFDGYLIARFLKGGKVLVSFGNTNLFEICKRSYKQSFDKYVWLQLTEIMEYAFSEGFIKCQQVTEDTEYSGRIYSIINFCREKGKGLILILGKCEEYLEKENIKNIVMIDPISIIENEQYMLFEELLELIPTIDGATFVNEELQLIGFAAILPAKTGKFKEDKTFGARHNSALRFSKDKKDIIVIVLSEDGPLRLVYDGGFINPRELKSSIYKTSEA